MLVIIALLGAAYYVFSEAGTISEKVMRKVIPEATKTPFNVGSVDVSILTGGASIKDLSIGNPNGYNAENAFAFDQVAVNVDLKTLMSDLVVIDQVIDLWSKNLL